MGSDPLIQIDSRGLTPFIMREVFRVVVIVLAVVAGFAPIDPRLVERWYSTGAYPVIQHLLTPISNLFPFALLDVLVVAALCAALLVLVRSVLRSRRKKTWKPVLVTLASFIFAGAVIYLLFLAIWGLNYRRVPMSERLVLDRDQASSQAILELGRRSVAQLNVLHQPAHAEGWRTSPWREHRLRNAYESVLVRLSDASPAVPGRLKSSLLGPYFRWATVDGMMNPFGLEAIANPDLLPFEKPFVAAHEWAHLAGYADESEASFVGFLTCIRAAAPAAYSGWLYLYWQINAEVAFADRQHLASALQDGPRQDIAAIGERVRGGQIPLVRDAGWRVYDQYLKANRVEEGVRSYGLVLTLLARARFEEEWVPVRREPGPP
jgi:hypothetical protein